MEGVHLPDDPTRVHGDRLRRRACLADDPVRQACPVRGAKGPARHLSGTG